MSATTSPPSDYRLLVPRDWFRVDLTHERWRGQLKTFVDKESRSRRTPAEVGRSIWTTLRNTAEAGLSKGALEFYLKSESPESVLPASLLVSLALMPGGLAPAPDDLARTLARRAGRDAEIDVTELPAGRTVRVVTGRTLDFHVRVPGDMGYLHLAFSLPVGGTASPMGGLCEAVAESLRWV